MHIPDGLIPFDQTMIYLIISLIILFFCFYKKKKKTDMQKRFLGLNISIYKFVFDGDVEYQLEHALSNPNKRILAIYHSSGCWIGYWCFNRFNWSCFHIEK